MADAKRSTAKKTPAKKSTAKNSTTKTTAAKKSSADKTRAKKATTKAATTSAAKKTASKKAAPKKTAARKTASTRTTTKSAATRPATRKSTATRSTATRSAATKRTTTKRTTTNSAPTKSTATPAKSTAPAAAPLTVRESTLHIRALVEGKRKDGKSRKDPMFHAGRRLKDVGRKWARTYHRLEVQGDLPRLDGPTLFVANHGFGGITDVNVFATWAVEQDLGLDRPLVALGHGMAWKMGGGAMMEGLGAVPASSDAAHEAFAEGCHVLVMPGGDMESFKPFSERNKVIFSGRSGFARLAMKEGVPILPIVTAGAGETLYVISRGEKLAKITGVERVLRLKALAVTLSVPMGLTVGGSPYIPLPAKLVTRVLPLMTPQQGESSERFAGRVHRAMQDGMDDMTKDRTPILG